MHRMVGLGSSRRSQLLRGVLDACLLAVIAEQPTYGYEMTKRLAERGLDIVGEGSIYPALARVERDGLVETYMEASNGGPARKYYRLTPAGRKALQRWIADWRATSSAVDGVLGTIEAEVGRD
jgi:PadR family transcriptional regulator PadR